MKKIIIGNWKLNLDHLQGIQLLQKINYSLKKNIEDEVEIVLAPSHTSLRSLQTVISTDSLKINLSSQDVSSYKEGPYTGEVSANQLKKLNIKYSIIGHSERRQHFHENDEIINQKLNRLIENEIIPIFCYGEDLKVRNEGTYLNHLENQLINGLKGLKKDKLIQIVFAYEPIWAIGTGEVASVSDIVEVFEMTKKFISQKNFLPENEFKFVYGGSVTAENSKTILNTSIIDGALVGGASLNSDSFIDIINSVDL